MAFHCFSGVAEIVSALWGDFNLKVDASGGKLTLPNTKTSHRRQKVEGVTIKDEELLSVLVCLKQRNMAGDRMYTLGVPAFRRTLQKLVAASRLQHLDVLPHLLQKGRATSCFRRTGSLDRTAVRGRWASIKTCRIYVDQALQDRSHVNIVDEALLQTAAAAAAFDDFVR